MMDHAGKDVRLDKKGSKDSDYCGDMNEDESLNKHKIKQQDNFECSEEFDKDNKLIIKGAIHHSSLNDITKVVSDNEDAVACVKAAKYGSMRALEHQCDENGQVNSYIAKAKATKQYTLARGVSRDGTDEPIISPEGNVGVPSADIHNSNSSPQDNVDNKTDSDHEVQNSVTSHDVAEHHPKHADSQKRKPTTIRIDGKTKLLGIDTIKFKYRGHKYIHHYATICDTADIDGDIGIKPRDEIREVNGHKLVGEKQKTVKKLFKKIKPGPGTHQIKMRLVLRRWITSKEENEEDVYIKVCDIELELILIQENQNKALDVGDTLGQRAVNTKQRHSKSKFLNGFRQNKRQARRYSGTFRKVKTTCTDAKPGMIDDIEMHGETIMKIKVGEQKYMLHVDEHLHAGVLDRQASNGVYKVEMFTGRNLVPDGVSATCCCYRISAKTPNGHVFLSSNLNDQGDTNVHLKSGVFGDINANIDERCFIEAQKGDERTLRSLIHREHFISYNKDTDNFVMKEIPMKQYSAYIKGINSDNRADRQTEDYLNAVDKLNDCKFDFWPYTKLHKHFISSLFTSLFVCGSSHSGRSIHS